MDSLVTQVRDLLPDLGEGFVHLCLEYFDNLPEKVINAILEGLLSRSISFACGLPPFLHFPLQNHFSDGWKHGRFQTLTISVLSLTRLF